MDYGKRIKQLRLEKGLTLHTLSLSCGLSVTTLHKIECCKVKPQPQTICKIAKSLDYDYDELFDLVNSQSD